MALAHFREMPCADERNIPGAVIVNCVAATGVNISRAATNGVMPATDAEVLALRRATGDTSGGEGLIELRTGMESRYNFKGLIIDNDWNRMAKGLSSGRMWYAIVGWYSFLPSRIKNTGQRDISHCVAVGPSSGNTVVIVDPLQKPYPRYVVVSLAEVKKFSGSMGFLNLGIGEYSRMPTYGGHVSVDGTFYQYEKNGSRWTRVKHKNATFSADSTKAATYPDVYGESRRMAQLTTGSRKGYWVNTTGLNVTYTEDK